MADGSRFCKWNPRLHLTLKEVKREQVFSAMGLTFSRVIIQKKKKKKNRKEEEEERNLKISKNFN